MLLVVFRMKWSGKMTTWAVPTTKALSKLMRASLGWQNVTATVGSRIARDQAVDCLNVIGLLPHLVSV